MSGIQDFYILKHAVEMLLPRSGPSRDPRFRLLRQVEMVAFEGVDTDALDGLMGSGAVATSEPVYKVAQACMCLVAAQQPAAHAVERNRRLASVREAGNLLDEALC